MNLTPRASRARPHGERMADRRQAQLSRQPGFTPVPNRRISLAYVTELERLVTAELERPLKRAAEVLEHEALRFVAATLSPRAVGKILRAPRPSRSDCPKYRYQATTCDCHSGILAIG